MKTKKVTKKLLALLLTFVFAMAMSVSTFAAELGTGSGSITITNATVGDSYTIYKIFDTDSTGAGSITATESQKTFYEGQTGNPFGFTANTVGSYNVSIGEKEEGVSYTPQEVIAFLQGFVTESEEDGIQIDAEFMNVVDTTTKVAKSSTVEFTNIPYGYYLVTSSLGAVVTVDSTTPNANVIDKNQDGGSYFTKNVDGTDKVVEIGEEFEYTLNFTATNYDGTTKIEQYTITDTLDNGLDLVYGEDDSSYGVEIKVGDTTVNDATITYRDKTLTIIIPWVNSDESKTSKYSSPVDVTVTYKAVLNEDADIQTNIENNATLTWTGDETGTSTEETIQTYALAIMKVDNKGNALSGATFDVTAKGQPVNVSPVDGQAGVYVVNPDSNSNDVVSPANGLIVIKGVDNIEYTLTETAAPAGYNLLRSSVNVTPVADGVTTITIYRDANGNVVDSSTEGAIPDTGTTTSGIPVTYEVVINHAGSLLPSTGGMGTTTIYILGAALVIGAGVVLVVRRRMSA